MRTFLFMQGLTQPKEFGMKFSLREIERTFSNKVQNFKLCKMHESKNFRFPEGLYFFKL